VTGSEVACLADQLCKLADRLDSLVPAQGRRRARGEAAWGGHRAHTVRCPDCATTP